MSIFAKLKQMITGPKQTPAANGEAIVLPKSPAEVPPPDITNRPSDEDPAQPKGRTQYERFRARMEQREKALLNGAAPKVKRNTAKTPSVPIEKVAQLRKFCRAKAKILYHKRRLLLVRDDYGKTDVRPWFAEIDRFIDRVLPVKLRPRNQAQRRQIRKIVIEVVNAYKPCKAERTPTDPLDLELKCADFFRNAGWVATTTKRSNDQGVDVFAEKRGDAVVLQCKYYGRPVGNKAVQEVYAGAKFRGARTAVVVSKSGFTASAKRLAASLGVHLVNFEDLATLEGKLVRYAAHPR